MAGFVHCKKKQNSPSAFRLFVVVVVVVAATAAVVTVIASSFNIIFTQTQAHNHTHTLAVVFDQVFLRAAAATRTMSAQTRNK